MFIKRALNKESSYEISLKLDKKFSRGICCSGQIVIFQFLHYTCFSSAVSLSCPLQVPGWKVKMVLFPVIKAVLGMLGGGENLCGWLFMMEL